MFPRLPLLLPNEQTHTHTHTQGSGQWPGYPGERLAATVSEHRVSIWSDRNAWEPHRQGTMSRTPARCHCTGCLEKVDLMSPGFHLHKE